MGWVKGGRGGERGWMATGRKRQREAWKQMTRNGRETEGGGGGREREKDRQRQREKEGQRNREKKPCHFYFGIDSHHAISILVYIHISKFFL